MDWYYAIKDTCFGPVSRKDMMALQQAKTINTRTLVWCDGMGDWSRWGKVTDTYQDADTSPPPRLPDANRAKGEFKWFYADKGQAEGPYNESQFSALYFIGRTTKQTLAWRDGILDWTPIGEITELSSFFKYELPSPPMLGEAQWVGQAQMQWHYIENGEIVGPYPAHNLDNFLKSGLLNAQTLVWGDGMPDWAPISDVPALQQPIVREVIPHNPPLPDADKASGDRQWFYAKDGASEGPYSHIQLQDLYRQKHLTRRMLVWRSGMSYWAQLRHVDELAGFFDGEQITPPPIAGVEILPPAVAQGQNHDADDQDEAEWLYQEDGEFIGPFSSDQIEYGYLTGEISSATLVTHDGRRDWLPLDQIPEMAKLFVDEDAAFENLAAEDISTEAPFTHQPAGPWTRFFARCFDSAMMALAFAGFYIGQLELAAALGIDQPDKNGDILTLLIFTSFFASQAVHFAVLTLSGNSIGKTLFGIRVITDRYERFTLWGHIKRELRVLVLGLGLYIPIVQQITMALAYLRVARGRPTRYDRLRAHVLNDDTGPLRRFFGIGFTLIVMLIAVVAIGLLGSLMPADALLETPD